MKYNSFYICGRLLGMALLIHGFYLAANNIAHASVEVTPSPVFIKDQQRFKNIHLINNGAEPALIRLFFRNLHMTETGRFIVASDAHKSLYVADKFLRITPRQMIIPAGTIQVARIIIKRPKDMAEAEFHTHLVMQHIPTIKAPADTIPDNAPNETISVSMAPIFEYQLPVSVMNGTNISSTPRITAASLANMNDGTHAIDVVMSHTGNATLRGEMDVFYRPPQGREISLSKPYKLSAYPDLEILKRTIALSNEDLIKAGFDKDNIGVFRIRFIQEVGRNKYADPISYVISP